MYVTHYIIKTRKILKAITNGHKFILMKKSILERVICPVCKKKKLALDKIFSTEFDEVIDGTILCKSCHTWYPIIKGIPRLLPEELKYHTLQNHNQRYIQRYQSLLPPMKKNALPSQKETRDKINTADAFAYEWKTWSKAKKKHYEQFIHWTEPFSPSYFKGKKVLDAGCGTGNHSSYMADWGAETYAIDLGEAITVAYENKNIFKPNIHYIQADINNPPFQENYFDFIYSQGVLHHLPNPKKGFKALLPTLKKEGIILLRMYNQEENFFMIYIIEKGLKRLLQFCSFTFIRSISFIMATMLYFIIKRMYIPFYQINKKLSESILPYSYYFVYLSQFSFYQLHSIVFDLLIAPLAFYYSKEELIGWYKENNLKIISILGEKEGAWRISGEKK